MAGMSSLSPKSMMSAPSLSSSLKLVETPVTRPFSTASRKTNDTALIYSEKPCSAAGVFTQNRVKAESVKLTKKNIANGKIQAVIANSGNANCCTGEQGAKVAYHMAELAAKVTGVNPDDVVVCSTGVIGAQLPVEKIEEHIEELAKGLSKEGHVEEK